MSPLWRVGSMFGHCPSPLRCLTLAAIMLAVAVTAGAQSVSFERPPIDYLNTPVNDPVAQLAAKVESGEVTLRFDDEHGYLPDVLKQLDVPVSSQALVFSKTSLQLHRISPRRPRALYFNDEVYVGWCQQGDVVEFAATDAKQGAIFYTLDQYRDGPPQFTRDRGQCLTCHASSRTQNVPGYLVRSVFADPVGNPLLGSGTYTTDSTSPFDQRWGGWYVTGTHGKMRHMGNAICNERGRDAKLDREAGANRESVGDLFNVDKYLSPHSDLVALMVLEHQTQMHNAIAAANYETRQALHQSYEMNRLLEREEGYISESANRRIDAAAENVVKHLLMVDEFALQSHVAGTSKFAEEFSQRGIRDGRGRSLRDFDLQQRLFRYPCSYLIHSAAFDGLPDEVRSRIVSRLLDVLRGRDESGQYVHLSDTTRRTILEILRATKPELKG